jgi:hypothetical protein
VRKLPDLKAGDIVGFSGRAWDSVVINVFTFGIPFWGLSHVGVLGHTPDGRLLFWESTGESNLPCEFAKKKVSGAQAHTIKDQLAAYKGRVWLYPLYRPLYENEDERLTEFLMSHLGRSYDLQGAIRAGGAVVAPIESLLREENLDQLFCSEEVAAAETNIGIMQTDNASQWSPNKLMRYLRRNGIVRKPIRLK